MATRYSKGRASPRNTPECGPSSGFTRGSWQLATRERSFARQNVARMSLAFSPFAATRSCGLACALDVALLACRSRTLALAARDGLARGLLVVARCCPRGHAAGGHRQ